MDEEHNRISHRLSAIEENHKVLNTLSASTEKLALNMEYMANEQERQGKRLEKLEGAPMETARQVKQAVITALVGGVIGAVVTAVLAIV